VLRARVFKLIDLISLTVTSLLLVMVVRKDILSGELIWITWAIRLKRLHLFLFCEYKNVVRDPTVSN